MFHNWVNVSCYPGSGLLGDKRSSVWQSEQTQTHNSVSMLGQCRIRLTGYGPLEGFGCNNVGPESQAVAQHCFTIGSMYRVIQVVAFRGIKGHPYGSQSKHKQIILFQCWASSEYD